MDERSSGGRSLAVIESARLWVAPTLRVGLVDVVDDLIKKIDMARERRKHCEFKVKRSLELRRLLRFSRNDVL